MDIFTLEATHLVPTINLNPQTGQFKISGRLISISGNEYLYFRPLIDWADQYIKDAAPETIFEIDLEYCSSGGIKFLFQLFKIFEKLHAGGEKIVINWHYYTDDDDSKEKGYQFQELIAVPFQLIAHTKQ
jgi:hypothetical protein